MIWLNVKDKLIRELSNSFDPKIKFDKRVMVLSDLMMFRPKEDKGVWKQKRGDTPEYFTVYFDGEYICGFDVSQSVERAVLEFWRGFKQAYSNGKIKLNPKAKEDAVVVKKEEKIIATTPEEKMAAQIVKNLNKNEK